MPVYFTVTHGYFLLTPWLGQFLWMPDIFCDTGVYFLSVSISCGWLYLSQWLFFKIKFINSCDDSGFSVVRENVFINFFSVVTRWSPCILKNFCWATQAISKGYKKLVQTTPTPPKTTSTPTPSPTTTPTPKAPHSSFTTPIFNSHPKLNSGSCRQCRQTVSLCQPGLE